MASTGEKPACLSRFTLLLAAGKHPTRYPNPALTPSQENPLKMMFVHKILAAVLVFLVLLCPRPSSGQAGGKPQAPETITELQTAIKKVLQDTGTPAAGVALVNGDSAVWVAGLGQANLKKGTQATEKTMFRIGSVSKMFVSLAILKLQQEGRLSLKDKVRDLVPEIEFHNPWSTTAPILVEHLLEHTTGWDDMHLPEYALDDVNLSLKQALDYHPHSRTSRWTPGTRMAYCNSGPPVAAYIIEKITGQKFEDYIQDHFFQPMGMETMTYFASQQYKELGATLYRDNEPQKYWNISLRPSGSINASPADMARMLRFFINRGRVDGLQLISEASLKRMETPSSSIGAQAGLEYGYGLSNYSTPYKNFVYRSHSGGVIGGLTDFSYLPDHRVGYVVMINAHNGHAFYRLTELIRSFQTRHLTADAPGRDTHDAKPSPENDIAGYYISINPRIQMSYPLERIVQVKHIWNNNNFTFSQNLFGGKPETHAAINGRQYVSVETGKISLVQVKDPIAGEVLHAGTQVLMRVSPLLAFGPLILGIAWMAYLTGSVFLGSIWFIRYWRGKNFKKTSVNIGLWPFLASLFFSMALILQFIGGNNPLELLGKVGVVSVSIMILTICFALASLGAVITIIRERKAIINKNIYWHLTILSGLHLLVTCYLLWHGAIGLQTWS
jgi:CubicO group peptidase (beta-lactamase class C family)